MIRHALLGFVALWLSASVWSQNAPPQAAAPVTRPAGGWQLGTHYLLVKHPGPIHPVRGKVEVLEFFGYKCPSCNAFEPKIEAWIKQQPDYVQFEPVAIGANSTWGSYARFRYVLKAVGRTDLHREVFDTVHLRKAPLATRDDAESFRLQLAFATAHRIGTDAFTKAYRSPAVELDLKQALEQTARYEINNVPAVVVAGKYRVDMSLVKDHDLLLDVVNMLVKREHEHMLASAQQP